MDMESFFAILMTFFIFYCPIILVLLILAAKKMKNLVEDKGYNSRELHVFAWCFWFPIFGYLYAIALPDLTLQKQNKEIIDLMKDQSTQQRLQNHTENLRNTI